MIANTGIAVSHQNTRPNQCCTSNHSNYPGVPAARCSDCTGTTQLHSEQILSDQAGK